MDSANEFIKLMINGASGGLNSATIGKIERFDATKMKADVLPLINSSDGQRASLLVEVPVSLMNAGGFVIRPPYKKGDIVLVVFADREIDNVMLTGKQTTPSSKREHSLDDAIVIGSILPATRSLVVGSPNDLVIGTENGSGKITMKPNGEIIIDGNGVTIKGSSRTESW